MFVQDLVVNDQEIDAPRSFSQVVTRIRIFYGRHIKPWSRNCGPPTHMWVHLARLARNSELPGYPISLSKSSGEAFGSWDINTMNRLAHSLLLPLCMTCLVCGVETLAHAMFFPFKTDYKLTNEPPNREFGLRIVQSWLMLG